MSKNYAVVQDTALPLGQVRDQSKSSLVNSVLEIQRHAVTRDNWLRSLECLYLAADLEEPSGKRRRVANGSVASASPEVLRRRYLDPVSDAENGRDYVAVSYTWQPSEEEGETEEEVGSYRIESRKTGEPALPSDVRDGVWERVLNYACHVGCENIWIDRECVDQADEAEQEAAIQSMHLVYSLSKRPVALLTRAIETVEELDLLINILCGSVTTEDEKPALTLLNDITSNLWWTRAWTFQEDYRASTRMTLLIPHCRTLERRKRAARDFSDRPLFGGVEGEICIKSMDFKKQATEFCLSYHKRSEHKDICDKILNAAAQYNVLLKEEYSPGLHSISRSMTPTIFADIGSRGITSESDRLAIAANCCEYTTRLDTTSLNSSGSSLSISMLALYLLNGEILENDPKKHNRGTLNDTILTYLSKQSLSSFRSPIDEELTFIKSCRFVEPQLTPKGIQTRGHLWKLCHVIRDKPMKRQKYNTLTPLETLATKLQYNRGGPSYTELAIEIMTWVHGSPPTTSKGRRRPWDWRHWMASEVEQALLDGKALRLGCVVHPKYGTEQSSHRAVFVGDSADDWKDESLVSYVFTSSRPPRNILGNIQKHVSLEVAVEWPEPESRSLPKLTIKRWLNGLCFFEGLPQRPVLFPWPTALLQA
ncbi:hypothetical protein F5B20DRAFT_460499 [Whalleya microplaca]|nr:hypothetical protein F5B20DRAFT_460499 [Whalleya microplaca]